MWQVLSFWWEMSMKLYTVWRNSDCIGLVGDQAAKSTNHWLCIPTIVTSKLQPCPTDWWIWIDAHTSNAFRREIFHWSCWESWSSNFKVAFLEKFWRDWALTWCRHGNILSELGASIFEVRNVTVWCQFQLRVDQVMCLIVSFFMTHASVYIFFKLLLKHLH